MTIIPTLLRSYLTVPYKQRHRNIATQLNENNPRKQRSSHNLFISAVIFPQCMAAIEKTNWLKQFIDQKDANYEHREQQTNVKMEPPKKKLKASEVNDVLEPSLVNKESAIRYKKEYAAAQPYPHLSFPKFANEELFANVRDEIKALNVKFKETDLFKLYQTQDLANITPETQPELASKLPNLIKLRNALYSKEFRQFISSITGCPELTDRVDMAASAYSQGCHLLCHDDVIGTRAVSFILYFCDKDWVDSDGGALELYALEPSSVVINHESGLPQGVPKPTPTKSILPKWNTMAFFNVEPGRSYHSVQEVDRDGSPRLSIQGWYHAPAAPKGAEMASLNQLKTIASDAKASTEAYDGKNITDWALSNDERRLLEKWINPMYLDPNAMDAISDRMLKDSNLELRKFLRDDVAKKIGRVCFAADNELRENDFNTSTYSPEWILTGPAHVQRFLKYAGDGRKTLLGKKKKYMGMPEAGALMHKLKTELMCSTAFQKLLHTLSGDSFPSHESFPMEIRHFRRGRDYTVAHHGMLLGEGESVLDVTLCFVDDDKIDEASAGSIAGKTMGEESEDINEKAAAWDYGENGGFDCYIAAEDEANEAAEVYDDSTLGDDDGGIVLSVSPSFNTLSIALRDEGAMRFIKYVSKSAPSGRWDIATSFAVNYEDGSGSSDEGEEGESDASED